MSATEQRRRTAGRAACPRGSITRSCWEARLAHGRVRDRCGSLDAARAGPGRRAFVALPDARRRDRGRTAPLRRMTQGGRGWVGSGWRKGGSLRRAGAVAPERRALMLDLGDVVDSLGGDYITRTSARGPPTWRSSPRADRVVGLPPEKGGSGDPSPVTARGVLAAIRSCCEHRFGTADLDGRRICVIGLGHVGSRLARFLVDAGGRSARRPASKSVA